MKNKFLLHIGIIALSSLPTFIRGMDTNNEDQFSLYFTIPNNLLKDYTKEEIKIICPTLKNITFNYSFAYPVIIAKEKPQNCILTIPYKKKLKQKISPTENILFIPEEIITSDQFLNKSLSLN